MVKRKSEDAAGDAMEVSDQSKTLKNGARTSHNRHAMDLKWPEKPNVLITGTPGTGKSKLALTLAEQTGMRHIDVSKYAIDNKFVEEWDEERSCHVLDEDKLLDSLEDIMTKGGVILEYHGSELFPERWVTLVFVLRTETNNLHTRLSDRGYAPSKLQENIECEIMNELLEEAKDSYEESILFSLPSNVIEDVAKNADFIKDKLSNVKL